MKIVLDKKINICTPSIANISEHWSKKSKRNIMQRFVVKSSLNNHFHSPCKSDDAINNITLPCKVILTRISPRKLDGDNLQTAMKNIRDTIADFIRPGFAKGRADDTPLITWEYMQEKGEPKEKGLRIQIYC